jgi:hypothetical protein
VLRREEARAEDLLRFAPEHREREKRMERAAWRVRMGLGIVVVGLLLASCGSAASAKEGSSERSRLHRPQQATLVPVHEPRVAPPFSSLAPLDVAERVEAGWDPVAVQAAQASGQEEMLACATSGGVLVQRGDGPPEVLGTASLETALAAAGLGALRRPRCVGIAADPAEAHVVFGAFVVRSATGHQGAVGAWSADGGLHWTVLPPPPGALTEALVRFEHTGGLLSALYVPVGGAVPVAESTEGSVDLWASSGPACLANDVCATFGAPTKVGCSGEVPLLRSSTGGAVWRAAPLPVAVGTCTRAALVPDGPADAVLFDPEAPTPLWISPDGGRRWLPVALPSLPSDLGGKAGSGSARWDALHLLPNGALLLATGRRWALLDPRSAHWCVVAAPLGAGSVPSGARSSGGELIWRSGSRFRFVKTASLTCGPSGVEAAFG